MTKSNFLNITKNLENNFNFIHLLLRKIKLIEFDNFFAGNFPVQSTDNIERQINLKFRGFFSWTACLLGSSKFENSPSENLLLEVNHLKFLSGIVPMMV